MDTFALTEAQRRTLAHLPRYRDEEDRLATEQHMREANGYPDHWTLVLERHVADLTDRVNSDAHTPATAEHVAPALAALLEQGYVSNPEPDVWAMTAAGLAALQA